MERPAAVSTVDKALLAALGLLLLGVGLGAAMRVSHLWPALQRFMGGHVLHAHSHTLYWGWAGLALFALFFHAVGAQGRVVKWVLMALAVQGVATWFVFLRYGYALPGVILSALTLVPFGAAGGDVLASCARPE